jgi:hypothetical protein
VYACIRCNQFKGDYCASEQDRAEGRALLHPLLDSAGEHWFEVPAVGELAPRTERGRFHIALLQLNRPALVEHRIRARTWLLHEQWLALLESENADLRRVVAVQRSYIALLRAVRDE